MPYKTGFNKTETDSVIFQENLTKLCPFQGKVIFCLRYSKTKKESKFIFTPKHNSYRLCQILPLKNNRDHKTDYEIKTLSTARHNTDKHEQLQDKSITVTFRDKSKTNQRANYCQVFSFHLDKSDSEIQKSKTPQTDKTSPNHYGNTFQFQYLQLQYIYIGVRFDDTSTDGKACLLLVFCV